ncbi:MAG: hypothetical protein KAV87_53150 [Desulfobacteraceae bacterium]|nr:hypothetical protein [Desulfobacteraceae bacterium]
MFYRVLNWHRSLSGGWKVVAWVVVALVAVVSVVFLAIPWATSSRLRKQVKRLKTESAIGKARYQLQDVRDKMADLELVRDEAIASEVMLAREDGKVDIRLGKIDDRLARAQAKIKEQSDADQGSFFNSRYGD